MKHGKYEICKIKICKIQNMKNMKYVKYEIWYLF